VVAALGLPAEWTFPPSDIAALTDRLADLWLNWPILDIVRVQNRIRDEFHIDHTANAVRAQLAAFDTH
jgi:hypothetical protein